jgi:hypothetical protein
MQGRKLTVLTEEKWDAILKCQAQGVGPQNCYNSCLKKDSGSSTLKEHDTIASIHAEELRNILHEISSVFGEELQ